MCGPRDMSTEYGSELRGPLDGVQMRKAQGLRMGPRATIPSELTVYAKNSGEPKTLNPEQAFQGAASLWPHQEKEDRVREKPVKAGPDQPGLRFRCMI